MGLYDKLTGKASVSMSNKYVEDFLINGENILASYTFIRDSVVLTNYGIYLVDVQGMTGKKVEVKFFPRKNIKSVTFETAGNFDLDVDIKIGVDGNTVIHPATGMGYSAPISFKVPKGQSKEAKEIINLVKRNYLI